MNNEWIDGRRWVRGAQDVAVRTRMEDLREGLSAGIVVDPGLMAMFIEDGRVREEIGPGNYTLESLLDRLRFWKPGKVVDVVLVARGPHAFELAMDGVVTKDEQTVRVEFGLSVGVERAKSLAFAMLPGPGVLRLDEMAAQLRPGIRRAVDSAIGREIVAGGVDRAALADALQRAMEPALAKLGLSVTALGPVSLGSEPLDQLRDARGRDAISSVEADRLERRADTLQRLRDAIRGEREGELRDTRALEQITAELERERLLDARDREQLEAALADEDRQSERMRELLEDMHARARREADAAFQRREDLTNADATIERQTRAHGAEQRLRCAEHEHDVQESLDGIRVMREMRRAKTDARHEQAAGDLDLEQRRRELEESGAERAQARELDRVRVLDEMRAETLVAISDDAAKAQLLEQMNRARQASQLTPEQLLALVADRSPEAAAALRGQLEAGNGGELKELYERMLAVQGDAHERAEALARELAGKAMETQAAVAREASRTTPESAANPAAQACADCGAVVGRGDRFCSGCGAKLGG